MNPLVVGHGQRAIDHEPVRIVLGVDIKVSPSSPAGNILCRLAWPILMHSIVLTVVGKSPYALGQSISRIPVRGESSTAVEDELGLLR